MKPSLHLVDTLDDRREVWHLLHRLSPRRRIRFLARACKRVETKDGNGPKVSLWKMRETLRLAYQEDAADLRLTNEVYGDLLVLTTQWGLDLVAVAVELEAAVRKR